jgi:23S rRNA (guanosine2251-2'-O)-methyltransferase
MEKRYRRDGGDERKEAYGKRDSYGSRDRHDRKDARVKKEDRIRMEAVGENDGAEDSRLIEGRNAVLEAYRAGRTIDRLLIQDGCQDGPIQSIKREARKYDTVIDFVAKERLDQISETGHHQGVIAYAASFAYAEVEDILAAAREKGEAPFLFLLENIEDPHNLGAIIRTANQAGAHGVIIPKRRAVGLTATVARASAGALNYTPVARVTNLIQTMEELKKEGIWFVCADMGGEVMYRMNLTGPIGVVIGSEGDGVSRLMKEKCDFTASIPMKGDIDSLNASVAAGVLAFEIVRQRDFC